MLPKLGLCIIFQFWMKGKINFLWVHSFQISQFTFQLIFYFSIHQHIFGFFFCFFLKLAIISIPPWFSWLFHWLYIFARRLNIFILGWVVKFISKLSHWIYDLFVKLSKFLLGCVASILRYRILLHYTYPSNALLFSFFHSF